MLRRKEIRAGCLMELGASAESGGISGRPNLPSEILAAARSASIWVMAFAPHLKRLFSQGGGPRESCALLIGAAEDTSSLSRRVTCVRVGVHR